MPPNNTESTSTPVRDHAVIVVFGASGDLAKKSTFPALYSLMVAGKLPKSTKILGYARSDMDRAKFETQLMAGIEDDEKAGITKPDEEAKKKFKALAEYVRGKYDEDDSFKSLEKKIEEIEKDEMKGEKADRIFYLALPPSSFVQVSQMLKKHNYGTEGQSRIVIEKPFGKDTESCEQMMGEILADWKEEEIYRIDHYLGEEMIRQIMYLRFANAFIEPLLNKDVVESISVVMTEKFGAEGRGGYFDEFGMIRDVCQNHILQAISLMTCEVPTSFSNDALRQCKVDLLSSIPPISTSSSEELVLGQYGAGKEGGDGEEKKGYREDETVPDDSKTATFAAFKMEVENDRWRGVPIVVKAGKALDKGLMAMTFNLRAPKANPFEVPSSTASDPKSKAKPDEVAKTQNKLVVRMNPDPSIYFKTNVLKPGAMGHEIVSADMSYVVPGKKVPGDKKAYEVVIQNVIKGEHASFVREDELVLGWKIFTPLLKHIESPNGPTPAEYAYGSAGPEKEIRAFEEKLGVFM